MSDQRGFPRWAKPRQLASATPPDLIRVISITSGTKSNLLTNLDSSSTAFGWDKLPKSQLSQFRAEKGVAGSGFLYAKPSGFTMTGLYDNKKLATQIGMTAAPKSADELTGLLVKAKAAGLTGMVVANKAGGGVFPYQLLWNSAMGPDKVAAWVFNAPDATIDTPESVKAAQQVVDWNTAGHFPSGVNAMDSTAADALFAANKGVFFPCGNWDATNLDKTLPGNVGFMPMPPMTAGGQVPFVQNATAGISDQAWNPESQLLLGAKSTAQQFVTNVQAKYKDEVGK